MLNETWDRETTIPASGKPTSNVGLQSESEPHASPLKTASDSQNDCRDLVLWKPLLAFCWKTWWEMCPRPLKPRSNWDGFKPSSYDGNDTSIRSPSQIENAEFEEQLNSRTADTTGANFGLNTATVTTGEEANSNESHETNSGRRSKRKSTKRRLSGTNPLQPCKRRKGEMSWAALFSEHITQCPFASSVEDIRDTVEFSQTSDIKKAIDQIFRGLSKEHWTHSKQEFHNAIKAFKPKGSVKPFGREQWMLKGMKTAMYHHQLFGASWMRRIETAAQNGGPKGGILADDMGLGKTLQMIALIVNGRAPANAKSHTTLVVVPSETLAEQWMREIDKHWERNSVGQYILYVGTRGTRLGDLAQAFQQSKVVVTTYSMVLLSYPKIGETPKDGNPETLLEHAKQWEDACGAIHRSTFHRVVFDEAHKLRNHNSQTFKACSAISATYKWAMSGTPLVNSIEELYSYCELFQISGIGTFREFKKRLKMDLSQGLAWLKQLGGDFMFRRLKNTPMLGKPIISLPITTHKTLHVQLPEREGELYGRLQRVIKRKLGQHAKRLQGANPLDDEPTEDGEAKKMICMLIQILQQAVGSPLLVWPDLPSLIETEKAALSLIEELTKDTPSRKEAVEEMQYRLAKLLMNPGLIVPQNINDAKPTVSVEHWFNNKGPVPYSAKLKAARDQISCWMAEEDTSKKILIFVLFLDTAVIFEKICQEQGWKCAKFTGKMGSKARAKSLELLNEDQDMRILIMTLKSGGVGLDLTAASRVLIFDLWWNMAIEEQAKSRVERIGQKHDMEIVRIAADNTIDDHLIHIQERKASQINAVIGGKSQNHNFSIQDALGIINGLDEESAFVSEADGSRGRDNSMGKGLGVDEDIMQLTEDCANTNLLKEVDEIKTEDEELYAVD